MGQRRVHPPLIPLWRRRRIRFFAAEALSPLLVPRTAPSLGTSRNRDSVTAPRALVSRQASYVASERRRRVSARRSPQGMPSRIAKGCNAFAYEGYPPRAPRLSLFMRGVPPRAPRLSPFMRGVPPRAPRLRAPAHRRRSRRAFAPWPVAAFAGALRPFANGAGHCLRTAPCHEPRGER